MNKQDLVKIVIKELESGNAKNAAKYFSEDFVFSGPVPEPMNGGQFLDLMAALTKGIPDWAFNISSMQEKGNQIAVTAQKTGTHKETLAVPGLPTVPATGKRITLPTETIKFTVQDERITKCRVDIPPGGGVEGIYQQLGVKLPETAPVLE